MSVHFALVKILVNKRQNKIPTGDLRTTQPVAEITRTTRSKRTAKLIKKKYACFRFHVQNVSVYQENFELLEKGIINLFILYFWNVVQILQQE